MGKITACFLLLLLSSCAPQETPLMPINLDTGINGNDTGIQTKATDTEFETNDRIGLYVVNFVDGVAGNLASSNNHVNNMGFTFDISTDPKWTPDEEIFWFDGATNADFYCYYPYTATIEDVSSFPFLINSNQSILANYKSSDFLWGNKTGIAPTSSPVPVLLSHCFSLMKIILEAGDGFTEDDLVANNVSIGINNIKNNALIDLSDGVVTASGSTVTISPYYTGTFYKALAVPQSIANGTNLLTINVGGINYYFSIGTALAFESNKIYTFTITLSKTGSGITIGINPWEDDGNDYGGNAS